MVSHDVDLEVNGAFANISLIASNIWSHDRHDTYRRTNHSLWLQNRKLSETYNRSNGVMRVRDVIPTSRLAHYGNYEYDLEREKMYIDESTYGETAKIENNRASESSEEPWMSRRVEDCFLRLISSPTDPSALEPKWQNPRENGIYPEILYAIEGKSEAQLQSRLRSKNVSDLWRQSMIDWSEDRKSPSQALVTAPGAPEKRPRQRRRCEEKMSAIRKNNWQNRCCATEQESRRNDRTFPAGPPCLRCLLSSNSGIPGPSIVRQLLSPEVAEFIPKSGPPALPNENPGTIQFFPSSSEPAYQEELFPYNQIHPSGTLASSSTASPTVISTRPTVNAWIRGPSQWYQPGIAQPIRIQVPAANNPPFYSSIQPFCPAIVHRQPIPVYQKPTELYQESSQRRAKTHHQGVDFNNLILLTKSAIKARRNNQSKNNPQQTSSFVLESRQGNLRSQKDVLQWLNKGYPKRARECRAVNSLVSELSKYESDLASGETCENPQEERNFQEESATASSSQQQKKRLYRDVLTNTNSSEIVFESLLDERYDDLERQAMEQYRTSEECLALRYQELERQGLEQYKSAESSSDSIRALRSATCSTVAGSNCTEGRAEEKCSRDLAGPRGCSSGFGNCDGATCSSKDTSSSEKAGLTMEGPIKILKPNPKNPPFCANNGQFNRMNVFTKSLTALNDAATLPVPKKHPTKGASGDKFEDRAKSSMSKGHVIVLSHRVKKSVRSDVRTEEGLIGASCCGVERIDKKIVIPSGGGDEKMTILRSPGTQVWLSSLWR